MKTRVLTDTPIGGAYEYSLKAVLYHLNRNGMVRYGRGLSKMLIDHLHEEGKIDRFLRDYAKGKIDEGYSLVHIPTETEAKYLDDLYREWVKAIEVAKRRNVPITLDLNKMLEKRSVLPVTKDEVENLNHMMGLSPGGEIIALTPKFFLIKEGTTTIDELVGIKAGGENKCTLYLRTEGKERKFEVENCLSKNVLGMKDVRLVKYAPKTWFGIDWGFWGFEYTSGYYVTTKFYTASPCTSTRTEDVKDPGNNVLGPEGKDEYMIVYPCPTGKDINYKDGERCDDEIRVRVPVAMDNAYPNFCWKYYPSDITEIRGIKDLVDAIQNTFGIDVHNFIGLAPWPCHMLIGFGEIAEKIGGEEFTGTCGG